MHALAGHEHDPAALAVQRHLLVTDLAEDVDALARCARERGAELVLRHARLEGLPQRVLGTEETVRGDEPADPLVRAKMVVVREVMPEPLACFAELLRLHALPQLRADRLPQALTLAQRLGVVRARHHVLDALAHQQALEVGLAAPGEVLAPLVGEHLLGLAEALDPLHQRLTHEPGLLVRGELPGDHVAGEIVQEHRQVHAHV